MNGIFFQMINNKKTNQNKNQKRQSISSQNKNIHKFRVVYFY